MKTLKFITLLIAGAFIATQSNGQDLNNRVTENIKSFAKIYGYVRYFHPSDEASKIDWDKFAVYGVKEVEKAQDNKELLTVLVRLFKPIAPSVLIYSVNDSIMFDVKNITPENASEYKEIYWQHLGLGAGRQNNTENVYQSERVNRLIPVPDKSSGNGQAFCSVRVKIDAKPYIGKEFEYTAYVKMDSINSPKGYLWVRIDKDTLKIPGRTLFFDNMYDRPITSGRWAQYKITGKIDSLAKYIYYGAYTTDTSDMFIDKMQFFIKNTVNESAEIYSDGFENDSLNMAPTGLSNGIGLSKSGTGGTAIVVTNEHFEGKKCLMLSNKSEKIKMVMAEPLFVYKPSVDKPFYADIGNGIRCTIPLVLYGTEQQTYPAADTSQLNNLLGKLKEQNTLKNDDKYVHYADLVIYYNAMKHFFPYFDVIKTNWEEAFTQALIENALCGNSECFLPILKRFSAKLHDGHGRVDSYTINQSLYCLPPIQVEWIENKLIITKVIDTSSGLSVGTEIKKIEHIDSRKYYDSIAQYISAGTKGWLEDRLNTEILFGTYSSKLNLEVVPPGRIAKTISVSRTINISSYYNLTTNKTTWNKINASIYYLNIDQISNKEIDSLMPDLKKAKYIICDLRGYPHDEPSFISHLLNIDDTCKTWMRVPQIVYPDYRVSGFAPFSWDMKKEKPHLGAKIVFITGGGAISYAESYMGFIQGYKLATIVGQPTAGTNGNVNYVSLPGGYTVSFTGMKVLKQDGSQLYDVGFIPDVLINKTVKGTMEGRDEFLEKAIEICKAN